LVKPASAATARSARFRLVDAIGRFLQSEKRIILI
jgi:hypothetical protein